MKLTWKLARKPALAPTCPCCDPIVFGHAPPCTRWESRNNDGPPKPAGPSFTGESGVVSMQIAASETAQAIQRIGRTVEQFNALIRELGDATADQETLLSHPHNRPFPARTDEYPLPVPRTGTNPR